MKKDEYDYSGRIGSGSHCHCYVFKDQILGALGQEKSSEVTMNLYHP